MVPARVGKENVMGTSSQIVPEMSQSGMAAELFLEEARLRSLIKAGGARRIRLKAGTSLAAVGQMAGGVGANTVCRWERGKQSPRGVHLGLYAQALQQLRAATRAGRRQAKVVGE